MHRYVHNNHSLIYRIPIVSTKFGHDQRVHTFEKQFLNIMYFYQLVNRIKIKYVENFTKVPTCFGVLNTPFLGEHTEY